MEFASYVWPGALLAAIGFVTLFGLLGSEGALAKSKQLSATRDLASGRSGRTKRALFGLAVFLLMCGTCGFFVGIGAIDGQERTRCQQTCVAKGYHEGTIGGSKQMYGNRHAFVACTCTSDFETEPLELRADSLGPR